MVCERKFYAEELAMSPLYNDYLMRLCLRRYEQKQPPVSSTTDGETLDADSSADAAEKADAETTETATESEAAPTENGAAASQSAQDPQDPQATAASN